MHFSALTALFIAIQVACVYGLPPKVQPTEDVELASFSPSEPISGWPTSDTTPTGMVTANSDPWTPTTAISGWPHSSSSSSLSSSSSITSPGITYVTITATQAITATTITVTDNSITWTPTQSISGWPPASSSTQTSSGQQVIETFTITYTSYSEETISFPPPSSVTSSSVQTQTPAFTIVTVTASPTPLASTPTGPFTVITVTASPTPSTPPPGQTTSTPRFVTITVSEVTIWPSHSSTAQSTTAESTTAESTTAESTAAQSTTAQSTAAQTTTPSSQLVTLTLSSTSVNESLNSTTVSYSSTVLTLSPPPTSATGTATVGIVGKKHHI